MSGTLALASSIAELDRDDLTRLVRARRPLAASGVMDPIGLAAELLRAESIARVIAPLDRRSLWVLSSHSWDVDPRITRRLVALGLVGKESSAGGQPAPLAEVDEALRKALQAESVVWSEDEQELADAGHDRTPRAAAVHGAWFTPALTAIGEAAECLRVLHNDPARLNRSGSVGVAAVRDIAERASIPLESASHALRQLARAGLTSPIELQLVVTAEAERWLASPHPERWLALASAFAAAIPSPLHDTLLHLESAGPVASAQNLGAAGNGIARGFPLLPAADVALTHQFVGDAERLGLTVDGQLTDLALRLLPKVNDPAGNDAALPGGDAALPVDAAEVASELPETATGVYLQPDLTVLAPGPLDPEAEAALAALTRPEHIGPATMRRVTEASLALALERGISPDEANATFARLSVTGVPQPLEYLLTSVADRIGRIVVQEHAGFEGRSRIRVAQPSLAETVLVDRQLQHLQLVRAENAHPNGNVLLFSRLRPEHVVTAFGEARYHASLGGHEQDEPAPHRTAPGKQPPPGAATASASQEAKGTKGEKDGKDHAADPIEAMTERVFLAARTEPEAAAFTRRLELAIRDKTPVMVTAEARGQSKTFKLLPVALTDGRLRATDAGAGVERTFPVSMIVAVEPA